MSVILSPDGTLSDLEQTMMMRGLFAPLGHAAWTGLVCGAIWHYQGQGRKLVLMALGFFALAVGLHALWDMAANLDNVWLAYAAFISIGGVGLFFVFRHLQHARQKSLPSLNDGPSNTLINS